MKNILSAENMKKVDTISIKEIGIPSLALMETAARYVAMSISGIGESLCSRIVSVCGVGNNGADGIAAARTLKCMGYGCVFIYCIGNIENATEEFKIQLSIAEQLGIEVEFIKDLHDFNVDSYDYIIDAIFGIGLSRNVEGLYSEVISAINSSKAKKIAVDIPSGINGNNGQVLGNAIKADITVTFGAYKIGLILYPGAEYAGEIKLYDIGFPKESYKELTIIKGLENSDAIEGFSARNKHSNKGSYGKLLIIAGNEDMCGAAYMCASAAFSMGVGLVKVATTKNNKSIINNMLPEAIVIGDDEDSIAQSLEWCDVILIGPGMGVSDRTEQLIKVAFEANKPILLDADAINVMAKNRYLLKYLDEKAILTPHLGEMSRLVECAISDISKDMINVCKNKAKELGCSIVMKDSRTVICTSKGDIYINLSGNSGMAKAGSGDVLAGIIAGIMTTTKNVEAGAVYGPVVHGTAGDITREQFGEYGMMPTDIIKALKIINNIE